MLKRLPSFSLVDDSPHASSCVLFGHGDTTSPHYFVYEVARDFLSAPRVFVVVEILSDVTPWVSQRDNVDGLGVFWVSDSDIQLDADEEHLLFCTPQHQVEIISRKTTIIGRVYGFSEAAQALIQVLSKDNR